VSKYCLQHSPVPVIVVRPTSKRDKAKSKRTNDPDRQGYREILAKSESLPEFNSPRNSFFANEDEAAIVGGAATAPKLAVDTHPLAQVEHAPDSSEDETETGASTLVGDDPRSPGPMMKSPHLQNLDSPELSSQSSSDDDEDEQGGVSTSGTSAVDKVTGTTETPSVGEGNAAGGNVSMSYMDSLTSGAQKEPEDTPSTQKESEGA
jgi:hypothetical protein